MNRKGFTLVELSVTILIVGLVVGLSVFGIINLVTDSEDKTIVISKNNIMEAARIYSSESDDSSWKENKEAEVFCVTVGELMNKGFIDKNGIIDNKDIDKNTYVIVKRNGVTFSIISEDIVSNAIGEENNKICTGQLSSGEDYTSPIISNSTNYTNMLNIPFSTGSADSDIKNYKCLYGESSSNVNKEGNIENNSCIINNLKHNKDYYVLIYMNTNGGTSILATGDRNYKTSDFKETTFVQKKNVVTINYNNIDTNGNEIKNPSYYFNSDKVGESDSELEICSLKNNIFTCSGKTNEVTENVWYKVSNNSVKITYPEENNKVNINARIYDGSNNYRNDIKEIVINKYIVKFYRNNVLNIDGNTNEYVEKYCITESNNTCSITSPSIEPQIGYSVVGWNTSVNSTGSSWNVGTLKEVNSNANYYAITKVNQYTYNIVYKSSSGKELGTATATYNYGTTNTINPKSFTGYTSPSAQSIAWNSTTPKTITFTYTPISYTISYNLNGGSVSGNVASYNIESSAITLGNPTLKGHTFIGWTGSNGNTPRKSVTIAAGSTGDKSYTANWKANIVTIRYSTNGGTIKSSAGDYTWHSDININNGLIFRNGDSDFFTIFRGDSTSNDGLVNWDNSNYIKISKTGYHAAGDKEWKCLSSNCIYETYSDSKVYSASDFCDSSSGDCTIVLAVNWSIDYYTYDIIYKSSSGTVLGTSTITRAYGTQEYVNPKSFTGYITPSSQLVTWYSSGKTITFIYESKNSSPCASFPDYPNYIVKGDTKYCCSVGVTDPDNIPSGKICAIWKS